MRKIIKIIYPILSLFAPLITVVSSSIITNSYSDNYIKKLSAEVINVDTQAVNKGKMTVEYMYMFKDKKYITTREELYKKKSYIKKGDIKIININKKNPQIIIDYDKKKFFSEVLAVIAIILYCVGVIIYVYLI